MNTLVSEKCRRQACGRRAPPWALRSRLVFPARVPEIVCGKTFRDQKTVIQGKRCIDVLVKACYVRLKSNELVEPCEIVPPSFPARESEG